MKLLRRMGPALALAALLVPAAVADPGAKSITWLTNLKKAQALAAKTNKPVMIDFYSIP